MREAAAGRARPTDPFSTNSRPPDAVMRELDDRLRVSRADWAWHDRTRPSGKPQQLWYKTGGRIKPARVGAPAPKLLGDRGFTDEERAWIADWASLTPAPALIG